MAHLPVLTGPEVIKLLQRLGFHIQRQVGSHVSLYGTWNGQQRYVVVPDHGRKELKKGTLRGILRRVGITREELERLI
jgi:predicted RNA binding protein YcfA (HicA-like mRNA interferase family)